MSNCYDRATKGGWRILSCHERAKEEDWELLEKLRGHFRRLEDDYALEAIVGAREKREREQQRRTRRVLTYCKHVRRTWGHGPIQVADKVEAILKGEA